MQKRSTSILAAAVLAAGLSLSGLAPVQAADTGITAIEAVQGTSDTSPLAGKKVTVQGVVTAAYAEGGLRGFYLQTAGSGGEISDQGSSAVFIYAPKQVADVAVGQHLQVAGTVSEYYGLTQISASSVQELAEPAEAVKPLAITLPDTDEQRERFESMLIDPQGPFTVADNYSLNQYGEITLAQGTSQIIEGERTLR